MKFIMNIFFIARKKNTIGLLCVACICIVLIGKLQNPRLQQIAKTDIESSKYIKKEIQEKLQLEFVSRTPSLGLENLMADWVMLKFLQYFGDREAREKTGYTLSPQYLEAIVGKDPHFVKAYLVISPASSMFAGRPERTIKIMEQGLTYLSPSIPQAYFVWIYKGVDEILFLGDLEEAKKSYETASQWASIAGDEQIAQAATATAKFLSTKPDPRQAQVGAWFTVWTSNQDKSVRKRAESEIEKLGGKLTVYPDGRVKAQPPKIENS